jgi:hypothetical protein
METSRPQPTDPRDPNAKTWTWNAGIGKDATYQLLHLESGVFYSRQNIASSRDVERIQRALQNSHPLVAIDQPDTLHVNNILELRNGGGIIEIHHGERVPFTILGVDFGDELFAAVDKAMTVEHRVEEGRISVWNAIQIPASMLVLVGLIGGLFSWLLLVDGIDAPGIVKFLVPLFTVVLSLIFAILLVVRCISPPKAEVLKVGNA